MNFAECLERPTPEVSKFLQSKIGVKKFVELCEEAVIKADPYFNTDDIYQTGATIEMRIRYKAIEIITGETL